MSFGEDIKKFNSMYNMPCPDLPTLEAVGDPLKRLSNFEVIIRKEIDEIRDDTVTGELGVMTLVSKATVFKDREATLDALTVLADWLGDIQIFAASELTKFGISNDVILSIIMQSNFSKMGEDGKPIFDELGKLQKGPNYWKPEPRIKEHLRAVLASSFAEQESDLEDVQELVDYKHTSLSPLDAQQATLNLAVVSKDV